MTRYLTSTAMMLALGTAAYANPFAEADTDITNKLYASDLIGKRVYTSENEVNVESADATMIEQEWNDIGEIDELILSREGEVRSVIVGVGGFLGLGEKDVAVNMSEIKFVSDGEGADEFFLVVNASVADVEEAPSYERQPMLNEASLASETAEATEATEQQIEETANDVANATSEAADNTAEMASNAANTVEQEAEEAGDAIANATNEAVEGTSEMASNTANAMEEGAEDAGDAMAATVQETEETTAAMVDRAKTGADRPMLTAPQIERDGYTPVMSDALNTEDLTGARVYGVNDEDIGEVSELLLTSNGEIDRAVIDVGGFLGLGEHPVALSMDELKIIQSEDNGAFRVYIDSTQSALEEQPAYEG